MKKMWLKSNPSITAEVVHKLGDDVAAIVDDPSHDPPQFLTMILEDEWSSQELTPVPVCAGEKLWVAVLGSAHPESVTYATYDNEVAFRVALATRDDILGHFEVETPSTMVPAPAKIDP